MRSKALPRESALAGAKMVNWSRVALLSVLMISVVVLVGWSAGSVVLIRARPSWPPMAPWTAVLLTVLTVAILLQSGVPAERRVWVGTVLSAAAGGVALAMIFEYLTKMSFGLDRVWFRNRVDGTYEDSPGRPGPQTLATLVFLSVGITCNGMRTRWSRAIWLVGLFAGAAIMIVALAAYLFGALHFVTVIGATGTSILSISASLLLVAGALLQHPDRNPLAWLIARPDSVSLARLALVISGLAVLIATSRAIMMALGTSEELADALAVVASAAVAGALVFYLSQHEQGLLIEQQRLVVAHAETQERFRILADNAVDVIVHLRGVEIAWVSQSVQAAFGEPPEQWIGTDFRTRVHPDDVDHVVATLTEIGPGETAVVRFRLIAAEGDEHWVDGRARQYIDAMGNIDGTTSSMRVVDDQVAAERQLQTMAHFDALTGLPNRAQTMARLEQSLSCSGSPGAELGLLYCDVDHFKQINDTHGHAIGDAVLKIVADRISECVRHGDTVGRMGGDEIIVLLPGLHNIGEAEQIAESIRSRSAEAIRMPNKTIHATLSIGATLAVPGEPCESTISRADAALYKAKQRGRDTVEAVGV